MKRFHRLALAATKRLGRNHRAVEQHEIDDAIDIAIDRTKDAQGRFAEEIETAGAPEPSTAGVVVRRAEDLDVLAHDRTSPTSDVTDRPPSEPDAPSS
jgi:3-hydroxy-3-methylglutaryl CoA synthase